MERAKQWMGILVWALFALAGCSQEERQQLVDQANQKLEEASQQIEAASEELTDAQEQATEQAADLGDSLTSSIADGASTAQAELGLAGRIQLKTTPPVNTKACYATFIPASGGRPAFLQLRSYRSESEETYPSVFLQGQVEATTVSELSGATVQMQMYLQRESGRPIAYTTSGTWVSVQVDNVAEKQLSATIQEAPLVQTADNATLSVTGTIQGVLP